MLTAGLLVLFGTASPAQDWSEREYGIGIAGPRRAPDQSPGLSELSLSLYENPSERSQVVAVLRSDSLELRTIGETVSSFARLLEYAYEEVGFPILAFSPDSAWIMVSLNCWDRRNGSTGWLLASSPGLQVQSWTELMNQNDAFFFLEQDGIAFYPMADTGKRIDVKLVHRYSKPDYVLYRREVRGRWMKIELETPSTNCVSEEEVFEELGVRPTRHSIWIRFLDERMRPTIFYSTRGC